MKPAWNHVGSWRNTGRRTSRSLRNSASGSIAGITDHPDAIAMEQMARNATMEELGCLPPCLYLLHDRDSKFCESFREVLKAGGVKPLKLPARSPNLNAFAER